MSKIQREIEPIDPALLKSPLGARWGSMNGEKRLLVTYELVEFEKLPVEVQDHQENYTSFKGIYGIYPNLI